MKTADAIFQSRRSLIGGIDADPRKVCEGGCGVIGIIGTEALPGRLIIRSCEQMRNRGNGKGGGVAAVGLFDKQVKQHYALHVAYLEDSVRGEVEKTFIEPVYDVALDEEQPTIDDHREVGLEVKPPRVHRYFVMPKKDAVAQFAEQNDIADENAAADELVFQNSFRLNADLYARSEQPRAFVLSHGRDLMILKAVGYAEQVARYYCLEETDAHVWIGHQRYPTRGRVWHPGGAHPFAGLHEALVHNGDFANYYAVTEYLRQRGAMPLFVTDTEVSVLLFDLYTRVLGYPLEYVIEALAPTPEGDFERLAKTRQRVYRAIQSAHLHGSPDGPWFFIIARNDPQTATPQLIGITDVSMLRPQVFAIQNGRNKSFGAIGSEKQAIDAFFEEVAVADPDVLPVADRYWNARGGSCTDGGAFTFSLRKENGGYRLDVRDKFNHLITGDDPTGHAGDDRKRRQQLVNAFAIGPHRLTEKQVATKETKKGETTAEENLAENILGKDSAGRRETRRIWGDLAEMPKLRQWAESLRRDLQNDDIDGWHDGVIKALTEIGRLETLKVLTYLRDRRWDSGRLKRAQALTLLDRKIEEVLDSIEGPGAEARLALRLTWADAWREAVPKASADQAMLVIDADGFPAEGDQAVCRLMAQAHEQGWRNFIVYRCRGDRFIGCGLGPQTEDVKIDVYGSSGDYLGSGVDGAQITVHGDAQDQIGQILKSGRIVIYGDVGQTLLYGAKGGEVYIMGSAAGRPLINAVGSIRAIINGTCLDYCAESFMAGREVGDGFVIINGIGFDNQGGVVGLENKYPGNNLFSLASGGACYLNDPYRTVKPGQLNGAVFAPFRQQDWNFILDYLRLNESLFGMSIRHDLLLVDGVLKWPKEVFRKVVAGHATGKLDWSSLPD